MPLATPFKAVHTQLGANFAEYAGWEMPSDFGDTNAELQSLNTHCAAFDLSCFGRITISSKAKELLGSIITEKSAKIFSDTWAWAKIADTNGSVIDTVRIGRCEGKYIILTLPDSRKTIYDLLYNLNAKDNFPLSDITETTAMISLYGPNSYDIARKALPIDLSQLEANSIMEFDFFMMKLTILRGSWTGTEGLEVICPTQASGLAAAAIGKYRDRENITAAGMEALKTAMTQAPNPF